MVESPRAIPSPAVVCAAHVHKRRAAILGCENGDAAEDGDIRVPRVDRNRVVVVALRRAIVKVVEGARRMEGPAPAGPSRRRSLEVDEIAIAIGGGQVGHAAGSDAQADARGDNRWRGRELRWGAP